MPRSDESSGSPELLLELELRRGRLRRSLREVLRAAVQDGRLAAGTRLPSSRRLAEDLGVSRGVVTDAYDQLVSEGYLAVTPRSAPVVASVAGAQPPAPEPAAPRWRVDFVATTPDVGLFPRRAWVRAVERAVARAPDAALDYGDHRGRIELRQALSTYLARVRGVRVDPGRIVVTQGFTQALDLLCRVLARRGRTTVAIETPSLPDEWETVRGSGLRLVGCPVDADGLRAGMLAALGADAVVVTPAHQFPTGAVMAPARRLALLDWAAGHDGLVIEDDYDAEFRYDRTPVGAVQGLDPGLVAHVGTASKTLAPGMRLGWASLPPDLVGEVRARKGAADSGSPAVDQLAFADLLASGEYERHVARARQVYRRRRDRLLGALAAMPRLRAQGAAAGMHVLLPLADAVDDVAVAAAAAASGVGVRALSPMHLAPAPGRGLLLGYGRLAESRIADAVDALARVLVETGAAGR
ncbi:MAG TPA: PLP-dependent aminotransferase family protein [Chloroflexota bacterium]|nr:PLP-dependent aminotransferase family protein [Chloroflexota bacterium]